MERESFQDPQIARILNDNFIPIKIDREERPDIDRIYMNYVCGKKSMSISEMLITFADLLIRSTGSSNNRFWRLAAKCVFNTRS
jgi:hypothetical protein